MRHLARLSTDPGDGELMARYASGDQDAFAEVVRRHAGLVMGVCRRALPTVQDAEDATQATFVLLAKKAAAVSWRASIAGWLYGAARRVARNARVADRRRARREAAAATPEGVEPLDAMTGRELLAAVDEELARLPDGHREALILCHLQGLSHREAAARLRVSMGCLRGRLRRGRDRLAEALARRDLAPAAGLALLVGSRVGAAAGLAARIVDAASGAAARAVSPAARCFAAAACLALVGFAVTAALPAGEPPAPKVPTTATAAGRVLLPDGKPAAGAKLFVWRTNPLKVRPADSADQDGRFAVTVPDGQTVGVVARIDGAGIDSVQLDTSRPAEARKPVTIRLPEGARIAGRVMTHEGKPAAGVSVTVSAVLTPEGGLDAHLRRWLKTERPMEDILRGRPTAVDGVVIAGVVTDRDGRFAVRGVGADRLAVLQITGPGVAGTSAMVVTRPGFDPRPYQKVLVERVSRQPRADGRFPDVHGPRLTVVVRRGRVITGTVTDIQTGRPVAGCTLSVRSRVVPATKASTDERGVYRLDGLTDPADAKFRVRARPPARSAYLGLTAEVAAPLGSAPIDLPVRLSRGAVVTGRLTDARTGDGVRGFIRVEPAAGNKFFDAPAYRAYRDNTFATPTSADGSFRLAALPGKAVVLASSDRPARLGGTRISPYRRAAADPAHPLEFAKTPTGEPSYRHANGGAFPLSSFASARVIEGKVGRVTEIDLSLRRGRTAELRAVDDAGRPLSGAWVAGLTDVWSWPARLPGDRATVYALAAGRSRAVIAYHPARRLFGRVSISPDAKATVVNLGPTGSIEGRVLDADGKPSPKARVRLYSGDGGPVRKLHEAAHGGRYAVTADGEGRFAFPAVIPGSGYLLGVSVGGKSRLVERPGGRAVRPGRVLDLGDVRPAP